MPGALDDLNLLTSEVHPAELQQDRAVLFLKRALLCLQRRRDAQIFHKPPAAVMLRGAMSFERSDGGTVNGSADGLEASEQGEMRHGSALDSGGSAVATTTNAIGVAPTADSSGAHVQEGILSQAAARAGVCLCAAKAFLSSNPYASLDMCQDLDDCSSSGAGDCPVGTVTVNAVGSSIPRAVNSCACSAGPACATQLPYVGSIIAVHCGHNGWPSQTELAALHSFFANNSVA